MNTLGFLGGGGVFLEKRWFVFIVRREKSTILTFPSLYLENMNGHIFSLTQQFSKLVL